MRSVKLDHPQTFGVKLKNIWVATYQVVFSGDGEEDSESSMNLIYDLCWWWAGTGFVRTVDFVFCGTCDLPSWQPWLLTSQLLTSQNPREIYSQRFRPQLFKHSKRLPMVLQKKKMDPYCLIAPTSCTFLIGFECNKHLTNISPFRQVVIVFPKKAPSKLHPWRLT